MRAGRKPRRPRRAGLVSLHVRLLVERERHALKTRLVRVKLAVLIEILKRHAGQLRPVGLHAEFNVTAIPLR